MTRTQRLERLVEDARLLLYEAQADPDECDVPEAWEDARQVWHDEYDELFPPFDILQARTLRQEAPDE